MRLVYVFDCYTETDYVCRVPELIGRLILWRNPRLDYCYRIPEGWKRVAR